MWCILFFDSSGQYDKFSFVLFNNKIIRVLIIMFVFESITRSQLSECQGLSWIKPLLLELDTFGMQVYLSFKFTNQHVSINFARYAFSIICYQYAELISSENYKHYCGAEDKKPTIEVNRKLHLELKSRTIHGAFFKQRLFQIRSKYGKESKFKKCRARYLWIQSGVRHLV